MFVIDMAVITSLEFKAGFCWGFVLGMGIVATVGHWLLHRDLRPKVRKQILERLKIKYMFR